MRFIYPIFGIAIIAAYVTTVRAGSQPFAVSAEKTTAKPVTANVGAGRPRGNSTFIWLGGYGGK